MKSSYAASTPMLQQYHELKKQHPGALLFFRLGDFYELFYEDAATAARELEITLTARHKETPNPVPMCGVPHHAASNHIARLVRKGYRVAICEQTEEVSKPAGTKKLVRREVVRVITPGTAIDPQLIEADRPSYLAAVCGSGGATPDFGVALLDLSTGEFRATQTGSDKAWAETLGHLRAYAPRELLFPESLAPLLRSAFQDESSDDGNLFIDDERDHENSSVSSADAEVIARIDSPQSESASSDGAPALTPLDDWLWQLDGCQQILREQFGVESLEAFRLADKPEAVRAAAACLRYAKETQRLDAQHITELATFEALDHLRLDAVTLKNLEIVDSQHERGAARTLLGVLDETVTGMGARQLRAWLLRPSINLREIQVRQDAIEDLFRSHIKRDALRSALKKVCDLERLAARFSMNTATPRDALMLRRSIESLPELRESIRGFGSSLLSVLSESIDELKDVHARIAATISDDPPATTAEGGVICAGVSEELDELLALSRNTKAIIASMENRERARTGIPALRIRHNGVFGYFIELSRTHAARVPADYERRQTLANAERYTTPELKEYETRVLGADERIGELESELFGELRSAIATEVRRLQMSARALAALDALASLAHVAVRRRYARPSMHEGDELTIKGGRHPVIEAFAKKAFVANDLMMNNSTHRLLIITGPNMGGKSTILRQTALIAIMAQTGSFIPATAARLPILDSIWTRVGASDDLASGRSTFMVEMTETAAIVRNATPRSLVLLDEIGRGTSTFDGLSIAWAIAEHLHDSPAHAAKTLFATHYHELTELAARLPGAKNYRIRVAEDSTGVTFLYKMEPGAASKSYGIEVAKLAGVPAEILTRARDVLGKLEQIEFDIFADESSTTLGTEHVSPQTGDGGTDHAIKKARRSKLAAQVTLFQSVNDKLLEHLHEVNVDSLTPEEMRSLLTNLREKAL